MTKTIIHQHLFLKAILNNNPTLLKTVEGGEDFLTRLVTDIAEMNVCIPARCYYVTDKGNEGLTGCVGLKTSHASFHHWPETGVLMLDLYSCQRFDNRKVIEYIAEELSINTDITIHARVIDRENIGSYDTIHNITYSPLTKHMFFKPSVI